MNLKNVFFSEEIDDLISFSAKSPSWKAIIHKRLTFPCNRELLVNKLLEQNQFHSSEKTKNEILLLKNSNCFTIATGHQLCYGTGPLYVIYKALSVIELCKKLNQQYTDYHFVPIFWLATEDHDFLEVNHFYLDYQTKVEYYGKFEGAVGKHKIEPALVQDSLWVTEPYKKHTHWKVAFQFLLNTILQEESLIFLDGDDSELKKSFSTYFKKEIIEKPTLKNVLKTNDLLRNKNIKTQWKVSDINLFYLTENTREKILVKNGEYYIGNEKVSLDWLIKEVEEQPERFSPSAGFRPLYQEFLIPNLAYVGGWGEIRYWLQLKSNFEEFQIFYPLLLPRFSYTFIPETIKNSVKYWGFEPEFLLKNLKEIQRTIAKKYYNFEDFKNHFYRIYQNISDLQEEVKKLSESLVYSLETQKYYWNKIYLQLENKLIRIIQNQNPKEFFEIYRLKEQVQPEGFIQERTLNISSFVKEKKDIRPFMEIIKKEVSIWANDHL